MNLFSYIVGFLIIGAVTGAGYLYTTTQTGEVPEDTSNMVADKSAFDMNKETSTPDTDSSSMPQEPAIDTSNATDTSTSSLESTASEIQSN